MHHEQGYSDQYDYWNIGLHITEVGLRVTWHRGRLSLGAGFMPYVNVQQTGSQTFEAEGDEPPLEPPYTIANDEDDVLMGGELHASYDLWSTGRLRGQLFALVEYANGTAVEGEYTLTAARVGLGVTF